MNVLELSSYVHSLDHSKCPSNCTFQGKNATLSNDTKKCNTKIVPLICGLTCMESMQCVVNFFQDKKIEKNVKLLCFQEMIRFGKCRHLRRVFTKYMHDASFLRIILKSIGDCLDHWLEYKFLRQLKVTLKAPARMIRIACSDEILGMIREEEFDPLYNHITNCESQCLCFLFAIKKRNSSVSFATRL